LIDPFKSVLEMLSGGGELTTSELANLLRNKGIMLYADDITNVEMLRNLLMKWGVQEKLIAYNRDADAWRAVKK
ncbi:MAG: hypothetical protein QXR73_02060, partial [Candidatus Micrarchaeaceae archaeon]